MSGISLRTNKKMVLVNKEYQNNEEVIIELSKLAEEAGYVNDLFLEKILEREKEYPTGLMMEVPFAMPHIGEGCLHPFVTIATLKKPVNFYSMDRSGELVPVKIVLLFGIVDQKKQVEVLKEFAKMFQDGQFMKELHESETEEEVLNKLRSKLGELIDLK